MTDYAAPPNTYPMVVVPYLSAARLKELEKEQVSPVVAEARFIIDGHFGSPDALGAVRLREHPLWNSAMPLNDFLAALHELLA